MDFSLSSESIDRIGVEFIDAEWRVSKGGTVIVFFNKEDRETLVSFLEAC